MRCDFAFGRAARRGLGEAPPLIVRQPAVRLVHGPEVLLELAHSGELRRVAGVSADALDRGLAELRPDVVQHQAPDAPFQRAGGEMDAERTAHRGAEPVAALEAQLLDERHRESRIESEAVLLLRCGAPLGEAAAE